MIKTFFFRKKPKPLVSIIMPARNASRFIGQAIESFLDQTYPNKELIIVDDGSTDNTSQILKQFSEKNENIVLITNKKPLGIPKSRNIALKYSKGEFIGHLDSDDYLKKKAIQKTMKLIIQDNAALVYSNYIKINQDSKELCKKLSPLFEKKDLFKIGWRHFGIYQKKAALAISGFNEKLTTCSDGDFFIRFARKYHCKRINAYLYYYRCHDKNIGHQRPHCLKCNNQHNCEYYQEWKKIRPMEKEWQLELA